MKCLFPAGARSSGLLFLLSLSACDLAPAYQPPDLELPTHWQGKGPFKEAQPADTAVRPGWWKLYHDPLLNRIEEEATASNADLQAAAERFVQARDMIMGAQSQLFPQVGIGFGASNNKRSVHRLFNSPADPIHDSDETFAGLVSWEPDIWSAIRNKTRAELNFAEQRAAEYASAQLSLQSQIAWDYFALRGLDAQDAIYKQSIAYYQQSLNIIKERLSGLVSPKLDVARAENLLYSTQAEELDIQAQRQVMEHAIAILANTAPSAFHIPPANTLHTSIPKIPTRVPSDLLQRRPDIASAERKMAQANRIIGIARAAFYPNVSIRVDGGFTDSGLNLFKVANSLWAYGADVTLPIFDGGLRRADLQQSLSAYRETTDNYRSTVLNAFREVEDGLSRTNRLSAEVKKQHAAVTAASETQTMTMDLYKGGLNTSLDVITAQVNTLTARIREVQIQMQLLQVSTELIRALGGGWDKSNLPEQREMQAFGIFQVDNLDKPPPAGGIDVQTDPQANSDLTRPISQQSKAGH
ncbi:efflux transporter outer membrane subunit [Beijerinckia indica]|uniref:RND efflux system, outer membrane lipoprotein, NodT family n=1 Tax=Beijerinckia indica subsp. indica (strain ATCC 9039 / DSM 1715 / NCIMB 8712) TaxID=395963 RepID=B2IBR0_BEII9|nr:efflux transporter outer membrane subunit [Beijerinckia indica]ACB93782.1 RND efflux system, outer membrane lipoprotein, NodT family [Beijerinckia indica subsp. indica ATCC 9039]